jgi:hypothetical protein
LPPTLRLVKAPPVPRALRGCAAGRCLPCGPGGRAAGGDAAAEKQGRAPAEQRPGSAGHARVGVVACGADLVPRPGRRAAVGALRRLGGGAARSAGYEPVS